MNQFRSSESFDCATFESLAEEGWTFRFDPRKRVWRAMHPSRRRNDLVAVSLVQCLACACEASDRMAEEEREPDESSSSAPAAVAA